MFSTRFDLPVQITRHARARMLERHVSEDELMELIECGQKKAKDRQRFWLYHDFPHRDDNRVCAAVVFEEVLVIKTVMIRWEVIE